MCGAFLLGIGMMYCLLIKWNIFLMMGGMALVIAGVSLSRKSADGIVCGLAGMAVMALPFAIYFAIAGNFQPFIKEDFINTFAITGNRPLFIVFTKHPVVVGVMSLMLAVICLFCRKFRVSQWLLLAYVPFYVFLALKAQYAYYFALFTPFCLFLFLWLVPYVRNLICIMSRNAFAISLSLIFIFSIGINLHRTRLIWFTSPYQKEWDNMQLIMQQQPKQAKFMCYAPDNGYGLLIQGLPACKYWAQQNGMNEAMQKERDQAVRERKPDIVIFRGEYTASMKHLFQSSGYRQCAEVELRDEEYPERYFVKE